MTNNASDFRRLYGFLDLHPGLVIVVPNVVQERQILLFRAAMRRLAECGDTVNKVLEVDIKGADKRSTSTSFPLQTNELRACRRGCKLTYHKGCYGASIARKE